MMAVFLCYLLQFPDSPNPKGAAGCVAHCIVPFATQHGESIFPAVVGVSRTAFVPAVVPVSRTIYLSIIPEEMF